MAAENNGNRAVQAGPREEPPLDAMLCVRTASIARRTHQ